MNSLYPMVLVSVMTTLVLASPVSDAGHRSDTPGDFVPLRVLHVHPDGDDENEGLSVETAWRTISAAAERTEPGDLVAVAGGTYHETVNVGRSGTAEHPIVFRAIDGETAVVTQGNQPVQWEKVEGLRSTWRTAAEEEPEWVSDTRSMRRFVMMLDPEMVDERPGTYYFDQDTGKLYVNTIDRVDPEQAGVVLVGPWQARASGFQITASHVRVEGFTINFQAIGIGTRGEVENVQAKGNTIYGCNVGILIRELNDGLIAHNRVFLNDRFGIQLRDAVVDVVVEGNTFYANGARGPVGGYGHDVSTYTTPQSVVFRNNLVMSRMGAYMGGGRVLQDKRVRQRFILEDNVFVDGIVEPAMDLPRTILHNTVVGSVLQHRSTHRPVTPEDSNDENEVAGNLMLTDQAEVEEAGFAAALRDDYRLHAGSPHLGTGAHPEAANVRYVSPSGDDEANGKTPGSAWLSLQHAAMELEAGRTVYILGGEYPESFVVTVQGRPEAPVALKAYGDGEVIIEGAETDGPGLTLQGAAHVVVDGITFSNFAGEAVLARDSEGVTLRGNLVDGAKTGLKVANSAKVEVLNNAFYGVKEALQAEGIRERMVLRNNLIQAGSAEPLLLDETGPSVLISERNAFVGDKSERQLANWREQVVETHASLAYPNFELGEPNYLLPVDHALSHQGLGWGPIGARKAAEEEREVEIEGFRVASAGPDRAIIQWRTPNEYAHAELRWQQLPDGEVRERTIRQNPRLKEVRRTILLPGLEPGARYRVWLNVDGQHGTGEAELELATPEEYPPPGRRYVSRDGSDDNDGKSWETAYRTLSAASEAANPGDTILVAPGIYREPLRIWQNGLSEDQHLTFRSVEPGGAIIDLAELYPNAITGTGAHRHITIDGFRVRGLQYGTSPALAAVRFGDSEDLRFVNNVFEAHSGLRGRSAGSMTSPSMHLTSCNQVLVEDNVFHFSSRAMNFWGTDGGHDITINHNTFYRCGIYALNANPLFEGVDSRWRITNNILVRAGKPTQAAFVFNRGTANLELSHNLYWPAPGDRGGTPLLHFRRGMDSDEEVPPAMSVEELRENYGLGEGTLIADPKFKNPAKGDFRLAPGSPAFGAASDGADLGARNAAKGTP